MKKNISKIFAVLSICTITGSVFAQSNMDVVATVNLTKPVPITVKQLKDEIAMMEKVTGKALSSSERREVLDSMINERLAIQLAEKEGMRVDDQEINQQITAMRQQMAQTLGKEPTESEFAKELQNQTGMSLATFRDEGKKQLLVQKLLVAKKGDIIQGIKAPTQSEIQKEYDLNSASLVQDETAQFSALFFPSKSSDKSKVRASADKLAASIGTSANKFDEVVNSIKPDSGYQATTNGIIQKNKTARDQIGQDFLDTIFALDQGKVSGVIEVPSGNQQGFFIVKVTGRYPKKFLALDDNVIQAGTTVRKILESAIMRRKQQEVLLEAQKELIADLRKNNPFTINEKNLNF
ncbi:MAG: membrane protein [Termitinemataceae bacterium]|nr:MAG: membrane protein [Termitinemataceae bacterium]